MELSDNLWREVGYVISSKYRTGVMKTLLEEVKIPSKIAADVGIKTNHVSNNLKELCDHGLVECVNPEARKGRLYRLTEDGEKVAKNLK